ncbi:MAG: MFS transporter, partial [Desulfomonile tiedjei]|nr:MFS transporter [Desulfomonile tiedjei]
RGKAIGITVTAVYIGLSVGPLVGGVLTQYFGWRSVFVVSTALGVPAIYFAIWKLNSEWYGAPGEKLDVLGSLLYAAAVTLVVYGFSSLPASESFWEIVAGLVLILVFIKWELKVARPVFNVELFTNRSFAFSSLAALINYSATFAVTFLLSLYLQYIKGFDPRTAGLILVSQPIMMAAFSPFAGRLSDRIEARKVASIGMAVTSIGLFGMTILGSDTPIGYIIGDLLLLGFGFALFSSPNMNAIMSSVEPKFYGLASGAVAAMRLLGQMLSMGLATLVFSLHIGRVKITPEHYPAFLRSVNAAFTIFAVICLFGIIASLARGRTSNETARGPENRDES